MQIQKKCESQVLKQTARTRHLRAGKVDTFTLGHICNRKRLSKDLIRLALPVGCCQKKTNYQSSFRFESGCDSGQDDSSGYGSPFGGDDAQLQRIGALRHRRVDRSLAFPEGTFVFSRMVVFRFWSGRRFLVVGAEEIILIAFLVAGIVTSFCTVLSAQRMEVSFKYPLKDGAEFL